MDPILLFDVGASHTRIGLTNNFETIDNAQMYPTPQDFDEGLGVLAEKAQAICGGKAKIAVGGIAGPLNREKTTISNAPNLPGYNDKDFVSALAKHLNCRVVLENDTALVGLGEAISGSGKGHKIAAYMTISTGVNGVLVVDGKIAPSVLGYEIGMQIVDMDKSYDSGSRVFEELVSGANFQRRFGKSAHEITDPNVWAEIARVVAYGLNNLILFWSPEIVILGGAVTRSIPLELVIENLEKTLTIFPELPQIKKAELGDFGGLWGALHLARSLA